MRAFDCSEDVILALMRSAPNAPDTVALADVFIKPNNLDFLLGFSSSTSPDRSEDCRSILSVRASSISDGWASTPTSLTMSGICSPSGGGSRLRGAGGSGALAASAIRSNVSVS